MALRVMAIETAGDQVRAVVADRSWDSFRISGTFERARAVDESDLTPAISRLVAECGKADVVISALPGELIAHRLLTLPFKDVRKLRQVVPFALEEHLPFPIDDAVTAFARVAQDGEGTQVFAAFARKTDLQAHLDLLAKAGLDPKIVTLGALALAGLLARASETEANGRGPCAHLLLAIDRSRTSLVLLDPNGVPRAMRFLPAGLEPNGSPLSPRVASSIVTAVRQTLLAHGTDLEPPDLLIAGPAAAMPAVKSEIADGLAAAVRDTAELDDVSAFEGFPGDWLHFGICVAMLLGEAPVNPLELLNFRQDEFVFRGRNVDAAPLYTSALLAAGLALLAGLHVVLTTAASFRRLSALDHQMQVLAAPALGHKPAAQIPGALREGISTMRKQLELMGGGSDQNSPLDILMALSRSVPPRLGVEFTDVQIDSSGVKLDGEADSFGTIDQVKRALAAGGSFSDIEVNDAKVTPNNSGKVDFHLSAARSETVAVAHDAPRGPARQVMRSNAFTARPPASPTLGGRSVSNRENAPSQDENAGTASNDASNDGGDDQ